MHEIPLLENIAVALAAALVGGLLARRLGVPPLVGYLLAGVAIGPFTPGFVGDVATIGQLAELGIVFLMFGVGLHFSLGDLWRVRAVAVPGALGQMALMTAAGYGLGRLLGWPGPASLVLGLAVSIASTVVMLRALMDAGLLESRHGRIAVGWLVLEDLLTVLVLLVLPALTSTRGFEARALLLTLLKAAAFVALMLLLGARVVPWFLLRIARTRSRELFLLVALTLSLGIALSAAVLFGVSLALGAFLAGVVVSESPLSHQVGADVLPFREAFAVLFFVSVGMLVNPRDLVLHAGPVAAMTALIVVGKALVSVALTLLLRQPLRTALVIGAGRGQIGEFSFILGQSAVGLQMMTRDQYSLLLAAALVSITLNPLLFRVRPALERALGRRFPAPSPPPDAAAAAGLRDHVVVVGAGRVGSHIVDVLGRMGVPRLVVESDAGTVEDLARRGVPVLFGDAANSAILDHAALDRARAFVVTIPDDPAAGLAVAAARQIAPALRIVARASTTAGVRELSRLGADDVIHPELEGGLELLRHTLLHAGYPLREVQRYARAVRRESYASGASGTAGAAEDEALHLMANAARDLDILWAPVGEETAGRTLAELDLRARTGASVVALVREGNVVPGPAPDFRLQKGDRLGLIGDPGHVEAAERLVARSGA